MKMVIGRVLASQLQMHTKLASQQLVAFRYFGRRIEVKHILSFKMQNRKASLCEGEK